MKRPRPAVRTLLVCLLLLVAGAAVNVAVAWGIAWNAPGLRVFWPAMYEGERNGFGARYVMVIADSRFADFGFENGYFGLPLASVMCSYQGKIEHGILLKIVQGEHNSSAYALPLMPVWPGFAINTVFYAAILWGGWLLFAAPFAVRRRRRIKRNLCPACAYPVGTSDVCTECGRRRQTSSNAA